MKSHTEKKLAKLRKILGFLFNICAMSEASIFKFNIIIIIIFTPVLNFQERKIMLCKEKYENELEWSLLLLLQNAITLAF